jgi:hypothetical protein
MSRHAENRRTGKNPNRTLDNCRAIRSLPALIHIADR